MLIHRAYKTELAPTAEQIKLLQRQAGACRFVFNWGLARKIEARQKGEKVPSAKTLDRELCRLKDSDTTYAWLNETASQPRQAALEHVDLAFKNFFDRVKKGVKGKKGFPRFKSRKRGDTVGIKCFGYCVENNRVRVPKIGWVKLKEKGYLPIGKDMSRRLFDLEPNAGDVRLLGMTVTERAGRWFASVQTEQEIEVPTSETRPAIGVDLGVKELATTAIHEGASRRAGPVFANPKALGRYAKKMRRAQRVLSRRQKGSKNRDKARQIVAKLHYRIACIRGDAAHKLSHAITREPSVIVLEDLNVSNMVKCHNLAKSVSDAAMSEIRRQVEYKAGWRGCEVVTAHMFYPSSKTCSVCGWVDKGQTLSDRVFVCECCGHTQDRDLNAAHNLAKLAASHAESLNAQYEPADQDLRLGASPVTGDEVGIFAQMGFEFGPCGT